MYREARKPQAPRITDVLQNDSFPEQEVATPIVRPNDLDILCGPGKIAFTHPGNRRFQAIVDKHYTSYFTACSKTEKIQVTCSVMAEIMSSGCTRFLKRDRIYDVYYVAAYRVGKDKVAHCLREMKLAQDRQVLRRQSQLRDQGGNINLSSSKNTFHIKTEALSINLQGSAFNSYDGALLQPSMEDMMLQGDLKMTMVSDTDIIFSPHPTNEKLSFGRATSHVLAAAGSSDTPVPTAATRAGAPFDPASQWWLTGGSFSSCAAQHPRQWYPVEPRNIQEMQEAAGSPGGTRFSKFREQQHQEQQVCKVPRTQTHQGMSALELLRCQQSFDPSVLSFNVQQQQAEEEEDHFNEEDIDNYILDTLRCGHQEEEQQTMDEAEGFPTTSTAFPLLGVETSSSSPDDHAEALMLVPI
jgi:hypothetical protein